MENKVKWGVLGTAYIFERDTARGMELAENCELTAIAGRTLEKAQQFKEKYGFQKAYGSYEELLEDKDVEAIYVALPNTLHYEWTIEALKHGKHVLCEKPLAPTGEQAREMFRTARENHVFLMEAFAYQHSPYIKEIRQLIHDETIFRHLIRDLLRLFRRPVHQRRVETKFRCRNRCRPTCSTATHDQSLRLT